MFRGNENDNTAATRKVTEQRTEYRTDNQNNTGTPSGGRYNIERTSNYNNNRGSNQQYNNRDDDYDNRGGWWEGVKENVKDWWHGDEYNEDGDYNNRGYNTGRNYDRDHNQRSSSYIGNRGPYNSDYNTNSRFNVTGRRVEHDRDYTPNYRNASYGGSYGGYGPSRGYGGSNDYDRSYGRTTGGYTTSSRDYDRSYGGGYGGSYGGYGPSQQQRSVQVYGGSGSNDYDRLYGNNDRQVTSRSRYANNNQNDMSDLFGGLSLLQDRHETTPTIVDEGGQRMMQWQFDVQGFNLDDINIGDSGNNKIEITGKHEDIGAHHRHARQFTRIITLPQNTTAKDVKSKINGRGLLTVSVPYSGKSLNDYNSRELTVGTGGVSGSANRSSTSNKDQQYGSSAHGSTGTGAASTTTTSTSKQQYQSSSNA